MIRTVSGLVVSAFVVAACEPSSTPPAPSASGSVSAVVGSAAPKASDPYPRAEDDTLPVYRPTNDPPDPLAQKYCDVVYESFERARLGCCPGSSFTPFRPTSECVRTLSIALQSGAVRFKDGALDACERAVNEAVKQCDAGDELPPACVGILDGQRDEQLGCRSSLECKDGLFCSGLGVSNGGRCVASEPVGSPCSNGVDSLASFVRQDVEAKHPRCHDVCLKQRCAAFVDEGKACTTSLQCGPERACRDGVCKGGGLPKAGEKCAAGACAPGHRCVSDACVALRRLRDACKVDAECASNACVEGHCEMRCGLSLPPSPPPTPDASTAPQASAKAPKK